jgi:hypothetical protein
VGAPAHQQPERLLNRHAKLCSLAGYLREGSDRQAGSEPPIILRATPARQIQFGLKYRF